MFKPRTILPTLLSDRKLRKHLALGISSVALPFVLTGNVFAQSNPGDPECHITGDTVTCTGDISDGFQSINTPDLTTFEFRNLTTPIETTRIGIGIVDDGVADITVTLDDTANITTNDDVDDDTFAPGLFVRTVGANADVTTAATINSNSTGFSALGIVIDSQTGNLALTNTGDVTSNSGGVGEIDVPTGAIFVSIAEGGTIDIDNSGTLSVDTGGGLTDSDLAGGAAGLLTNNFGSDTLTQIINSGDINAIGNITSGIVAVTRETGVGSARVTVDNSGAISVNGSNAQGIFLQSLEGFAEQAGSNSGDIVVENADNSGGIRFLNEGTHASTVFTNSGDITLNGTEGSGIFFNVDTISGEDDTTLIDLTNSGNITLNTDEGSGIGVVAALDDNIDFLLDNSGVIDLTNTTGVQSIGISALTNNDTGNGDAGQSNIALTNSGDILTAGSAGAVVLIADTISFDNSGDLRSTSTGRPVLQLQGIDSNSEITFNHTGLIRTDSNIFDGVFIGNAGVANVSISDNGQIDVANSGGAGVGVRVQDAVANITLDNGAIFGGLVTDDEDDTLIATNNSLIEGSIFLAGGNDIVSFTGSTTQLSGNLQTGTGNDEVSFNATQIGTDSNLVLVDLGTGDDIFNLINVTNQNFNRFSSINGGDGDDVFNFDIDDNSYLLTALPGFNFETYNQTGQFEGVVSLNADFSDAITYNINGGRAEFITTAPNLNVTTAAGTEFGFSGSLNNLTVGGDFLPGGEEGLNNPDVSDVGIVLGDFVLTSTGRFVVGIRADGTSNILDVRGSATLNDNDLVILSLSPIDDFTGTQNFVFLTAVNGVTGQFGSFNASDFPFLDLSLIHNPNCLLYTSPSPRDLFTSRMPSSA